MFVRQKSKKNAKIAIYVANLAIYVATFYFYYFIMRIFYEGLFNDMKQYKNDSRLANKKILIVDDSPEIRNVVSAVLTYGGARVYKAGNGKEALELLASSKTDAVLMDIHMPVMDGITASKVIKNCEKFQTKPIILFSSNHLKLENYTEDSLRVESSLAKPFGATELLEKVIEVISDLEGQTLNRK